MLASSPYRLTLFLCLTEILALSAIATFPALLPNFRDLWKLSNTEAGWINAVYFGGYMISAPVLTGITDRFDARKIMVFGSSSGAVAALLFSTIAEGFRSALVLRFVAGISLAGVYMPGLKVVSDHTEGRLQSRFVSFYTASFSIGISLSYLMAGEIYRMWGWRWAFAISGGTAAAAAALIWAFAPPARIRAGGKCASIVSDCAHGSLHFWPSASACSRKKQPSGPPPGSHFSSVSSAFRLPSSATNWRETSAVGDWWRR